MPERHQGGEDATGGVDALGESEASGGQPGNDFATALYREAYRAPVVDFWREMREQDLIAATAPLPIDKV